MLKDDDDRGRADIDRRSWLHRTVQVAGGVLAAAVGVPLLALAGGPVLRRGRAALWVSLGPLADFAVGGVQRVHVSLPTAARALSPLAVYLWRPSADEVVVFSRECTDLRCPVTWDAGSGWFFCPCHGGIFATDGTPRAGPPSRPLDRYAVRIRASIVEIDLNSLAPSA